VQPASRPLHEHELEDVIRWLRELSRGRAYATITLTMQAGQIMHVRHEGVVKPGERLPELWKLRSER
jgi:predicted lipid-binding transport protein (Tim44 family)